VASIYEVQRPSPRSGGRTGDKVNSENTDQSQTQRGIAKVPLQCPMEFAGRVERRMLA
jgi:hypothetical protein